MSIVDYLVLACFIVGAVSFYIGIGFALYHFVFLRKKLVATVPITWAMFATTLSVFLQWPHLLYLALRNKQPPA